MTVMALKKYIKDSLFVLLLIPCFLGCKTERSDNNGFILEEFSFDNLQLDSITNAVAALYSYSLSENNLSNENGNVLILELSGFMDNLLFSYVCLEKSDAIYKYIFRNNKRIVGYKKTALTEVLLVSSIDDLTDFGNSFSCMMHPTGNYKNLPYLYFPKDLYSKGSLGWPNFDLVFDPRFIVYRYDGKNFIALFSTTNINWPLDIGEADI